MTKIVGNQLKGCHTYTYTHTHTHTHTQTTHQICLRITEQV